MSGKLVLQAAVVTVVVFLSLTMYTFWAAKKGYDFNFLGPFLFAAIVTLFIFSIIQVKAYLVLSLVLITTNLLHNFLHVKHGYILPQTTSLVSSDGIVF